MAVPLVNRVDGEIIFATHLNDIKSYIEDAGYRVNTLELWIKGNKIIDENFNILGISTLTALGNISGANLSGINTGDQVSSDFALSALGDVVVAGKAKDKILMVGEAGKHIYIDLPDGSKWESDGVGYIKPKNSKKVKVVNVDGAISTETDPIFTAWDKSTGISIKEFQVTDLKSYQVTSEKGVANGYAGLDNGAKIPLQNLPSTLLKYMGVWNPVTNTPELVSPDLTKIGFVYNVGAKGSRFGYDWNLGDWAIYNESGVIELSKNSDDVVKVNNQTGTVELDLTDMFDVDDTNKGEDKTLIVNSSGDHEYVDFKISGLKDVDTSSIGNGKIPKWNTSTSKWEMKDDENTTYSSSDFDLSGLSDVSTTGITNDSILKWDNVESKWKIGVDNNTTYSSSDFSLASLSDVDATNKDTDKILQVGADGKHEYVTMPDPDVSNLVPYSGATSDVNLGAKTLTAKYFVGDGSQLTNLPGGDVSGLVPYVGADKNIDLNSKQLSNVSRINIGNSVGTESFNTSGSALIGSTLYVGTTNRAKISHKFSGGGVLTIQPDLGHNTGLLDIQGGVSINKGVNITGAGNTSGAPLIVHMSDSDYYWTALFYNDTYDKHNPQFGYYGYNNGDFAMGTEVNTDLLFYTNGYYNERMKLTKDGHLQMLGNGTIQASGYKSSDGSTGATGSFTSGDGKTITVKNGLIVGIN